MSAIDMAIGAAALAGTVGAAWAAQRALTHLATEFVAERMRAREEHQRDAALGPYALKYATKRHELEIDSLRSGLRDALEAVREFKAETDGRNAVTNEAFKCVEQDMEALATERGKDREKLALLVLRLQQQEHAIAGLRERLEPVQPPKKPAARKRAR